MEDMEVKLGRYEKRKFAVINWIIRWQEQSQEMTITNEGEVN